MAVVCFTAAAAPTTTIPIALPFSSLSPTLAPLSSNPLFWQFNIPVCVYRRSFVGPRIYAPIVLKERGAFIAKASSDIEGGGTDGPVPPSESEESIPVENLPLESKLQLKLEQKMRMKLAKKIRLRRKKLIRKRRLRKKGRWPPSKLKKNKNV